MIGLLNCYHFDLTPGHYQETYEPICMNYLKKIMPQETIKTYQVAQNEFPKNVDECKGWILTGSPASAYEDEPWVRSLLAFIKKAEHEKVKMLGICFGHQVIAQALGGRVEKSNKGWGIGVRSFSINKKAPWMTKDFDECSLLFSHQDQVTKLPDGATILASDPFCPIQMYCIDEHVFCLQGHPEFTREYALKRYKERETQYKPETFRRAINELELPTDELIVGKWIKEFFK